LSSLHIVLISFYTLYLPDALPIHRETVDGPRVERHRRDMAGVHNMPLPSGSPQYRGISGSTFSAHSSMPPTRFFTLRKPNSRRKFVMRAERTPVLQYTTISSAVF